jgi:hypothetical protein
MSLNVLTWVNEERIALSFQFFSKTIKNVRENPRAAVWLVSPVDLTAWVLDIRYLHSETDGPTFEQMDMQLEAIASMSGQLPLLPITKPKTRTSYRESRT